MSELVVQIESVEGAKGVAVVSLRGSIDARTVFSFQSRLNSLLEKGCSRLVVDMEEVKYVNSTGLGYLINLADTLSSDEGEIALVRVQPKVKVVFDMLGLNQFFRVFRSREEAVSYFTGRVAATLESPAAPPVSSSAETLLLRQGRPAPAPGEPPGAAPPAPAPAPAPGEARPQEETRAMPRVGAPAAATGAPPGAASECGGCGIPLVMAQPGTYKCPRCMSLLEFRSAGQVVRVKRRDRNPVQVSLDFSPGAVEGLVALVRAVALRSGLDETRVGALGEALGQCLRVVLERAYGGNERSTVHALILGGSSETEVRLADYGRALSGQEPELQNGARARLDRFEVQHHPKGGNVITLLKRAT